MAVAKKRGKKEGEEDQFIMQDSCRPRDIYFAAPFPGGINSPWLQRNGNAFIFPLSLLFFSAPMPLFSFFLGSVLSPCPLSYPLFSLPFLSPVKGSTYLSREEVNLDLGSEARTFISVDRQ